ncbi:hypothetical protein ACWD5A_31165, partial [Streptomyces sp. NPDC002491]
MPVHGNRPATGCGGETARKQKAGRAGRCLSHRPVLGFLPGITDMNHTKEIWEETIAEFPKMWLQD